MPQLCATVTAPTEGVPADGWERPTRLPPTVSASSGLDDIARRGLDFRDCPISVCQSVLMRVRDFQATRGWYEQLLGEPTFIPHATEAVWTLADNRSVYVVEHPGGPGNSAVTVFLDDLEARVEAIAARGLEPDERETYDNGVRKVIYRDPDGNELGFAGPSGNTGSEG